MPSTTTPGASAAQSTTSDNQDHDTARAIGCDCANEWLNRRPDDATPPASPAAWRARCYADAVREHEDRPDFLQLLTAWELGFDSTMNAARRPQPAASRLDMIKRLSGRAEALAGLLALFDLLPANLLPPARQESDLALCADIAEDMACDLAALVGGAA